MVTVGWLESGRMTRLMVTIGWSAEYTTVSLAFCIFYVRRLLHVREVLSICRFIRSTGLEKTRFFFKSPLGRVLLGFFLVLLGFFGVF